MTRRKVIKVINPKSLFFMAILNGILKKLNGSAGETETPPSTDDSDLGN